MADEATHLNHQAEGIPPVPEESKSSLPEDEDIRLADLRAAKGKGVETSNKPQKTRKRHAPSSRSVENSDVQVMGSTAQDSQAVLAEKERQLEEERQRRARLEKQQISLRERLVEAVRARSKTTKLPTRQLDDEAENSPSPLKKPQHQLTRRAMSEQNLQAEQPDLEVMRRKDDALAFMQQQLEEMRSQMQLIQSKSTSVQLDEDPVQGSPFSDEIQNEVPPGGYKPPTVEKYD